MKRRAFLAGFAAALAAPAIVKAGVLMPVRSLFKPPAPSIIMFSNPSPDSWVRDRFISPPLLFAGGAVYDHIKSEWKGKMTPFVLQKNMPALTFEREIYFEPGSIMLA